MSSGVREAKRVVLCDDHEIVREAIKSRMANSPIVEIVGEAVVLRGAVASPVSQSMAESVAHYVLPVRRIRNETDVVPVPEPTDVEHLP